jgi:hypothetical protein
MGVSARVADRSVGVQLTIRLGTEQPMQTRLESVFAALPACGQAARRIVLFDHIDVETAFARIKTNAEPGGSDNDDALASFAHGDAASVQRS